MSSQFSSIPQFHCLYQPVKMWRNIFWLVVLVALDATFFLQSPDSTSKCGGGSTTPFLKTVDDPNCPHVMYIVGLIVGDKEIEIFRSCYDPKTMTAYYSISPYIPTNSRADRPQTEFFRDGLISAADAASFQRANIYNQFEALLGPGQQYIPSPQSSSFDRGHLTPSADFSDPRVMEQTNRYINAFPQHYRINRSNWRTIENWVRQFEDTVSILTGVLGILELNNMDQQPTPIYLAEGKNPVPKWVYKIVHSEKQEMTYVIMTSNNGWATERPDASEFCKEIPCPPSLILKGFGFTICCEPQDFIDRNLPNYSDKFEK
ncbi:uncharacterized protein LOC108115919 [Drosophila eugracilis]|uniref:uncharacterized protein LOC108115919 n=1 Tax=Drosophila eugracilis TaxID=29029 RepID=UPI001BDA02F2|nr:uncharacterized protein LOC108115919 [Drosophila eugracilis]